MTNHQRPVAWWKASQIRVALGLFVPALFRIVQHTCGKWLAAHLGIDVLTMSAENVIDWLIALLALLGGGFWIKKRVKAGKDPGNDTRPIRPPKIVTKVARLTDGVRCP